MKQIKLLGGRLIIGKGVSQYTGQADNFFSLMTQRFGIDYVSKNRLKAYKNIVYGCVSLIGDALGEYQPYLEEKRGKVWERVDHEFIDLLRNPSGRPDPSDPQADAFTSFNLWEGIGSYQQLQGEGFMYLELGKTTGRPRGIRLLRPDKVGTDIDDNGKINGYFIRQEGKDAIPLEIKEVLRFPLFNPLNPYKGKGTVEAGSDYIETDEGTAQFTKNFFKNGAGLSGVLSVKGEVTKNAFKKFTRAWRKNYQGVDNAGKVMIVRDSDASFEKTSLGLNELDMAELRKMSLDDVAMMFKVPLALLGKIVDGTGLGRGNIETLEYIFAKWNIDKKMIRFDGVIMFALQRYYQLDPSRYRVVHENIIPADKEYELNRLDKGVDRWITRNEIRAGEEAPDIDGGDQLYVPAMQIPINEASTAPDPATKSIYATVIRKVVPKKAVLAGKKKAVSRTSAEKFRKALMRNQAQYEKLYKKVLTPIWKQQRKESLDNLEAHSASYKTKASGQKLFDDAKYDGLMTGKLQPTLHDLAITQGGLAMSFAGDEENEFYLSTQMIEYLRSGTHKMATAYNDETIDALNTTLAQGIEMGEGIDDLKIRVNGVFDNVEGYRAERIARTETLKASNSATEEAYKQTGFVTGKEWVVNPDACEQCLEFDGKQLNLGESFLPIGASYTVGDGEDAQTFTNDYDDVDDPPLHPNCRCTIIPIS